MRNDRISIQVLLCTLFFTPALHSSVSGASLGLNLGTMGFGGDVSLSLGDEFSARFGMDFLGINRSDDIDAISYELEASLAWVPLLLDYNPGGGAFRLSAGLVMNLNDVTLESSSTESIEIGGHTYTPQQFGKLITDIDSRGAAPYLGIGFGRCVPPKGAVSVTVDLGAMFQAYTVTLSHEGGNIPPALEEQFMDDLSAESKTVEDDLNDSFGVYPVLKLGVSIGL